MDVVELHRRAIEAFGERVNAVAADQWDQPTPCAEWNVRQLVNHVVGENRWAVPLFAGRTVADVGDTLDGDLLGDDPQRAWATSANVALEAVARPGAMEEIVHLSFGDFPGHDYASQLFADALIHGWDLARATAGDERLDPELVKACAAWFSGWEEGYRSAGAVGPRPPVSEDADEQARLLGAFGRSASR
jgi:uncharacterized protein (TIGR03086 family)